jgi:hypothetical protein
MLDMARAFGGVGRQSLPPSEGSWTDFPHRQAPSGGCCPAPYRTHGRIVRTGVPYSLPTPPNVIPVTITAAPDA